MFFQKRYLFVVVTLAVLYLSLLLTLVSEENVVFASEGVELNPIKTPSYQSSLTYPEYAGLTELSGPPSYQSSLTYPEYAGLTEPITTPRYQSSLTYPEYAGLNQPITKRD